MSEARQCENCKSELAATATFCPRCGQRVAAPAAAAPAAAPPPAPPAPPPPAPPPPLPPPPPVATAMPATPAVAPSAPRRSSAWPAILIGCGVVFLLLVGIGGYVGYKGYQKAKTGWGELQTEFEKAKVKTDSGQTDEATDDKTEGTTNDEATPTADSKPVIRVSDGVDPADPPQAYSVERVPPLSVEEGRPFGPVSNGDQAAGLVLAQPDVRDWVKAVEQARAEGKQRAAMLTVELIPGTGNYLIHLFENVMDDEPGHTATFGWFRVDKETGAVSNETTNPD